jgi:hypothetical protein
VSFQEIYVERFKGIEIFRAFRDCHVKITTGTSNSKLRDITAQGISAQKIVVRRLTLKVQNAEASPRPQTIPRNMPP